MTASGLQGWVDDFADAVISRGQTPAQPDLVDYLTCILDRHRARVGGGLAGALIAVQKSDPPYLIDGRPLSDNHLRGYLWSLLVAGMNMTAAGIVNAVPLLALHDPATECMA